MPNQIKLEDQMIGQLVDNGGCKLVAVLNLPPNCYAKDGSIRIVTQKNEQSKAIYAKFNFRQPKTTPFSAETVATVATVEISRDDFIGLALEFGNLTSIVDASNNPLLNSSFYTPALVTEKLLFIATFNILNTTDTTSQQIIIDNDTPNHGGIQAVKRVEDLNPSVDNKKKGFLLASLSEIENLNAMAGECSTATPPDDAPHLTPRQDAGNTNVLRWLPTPSKPKITYKDVNDAIFEGVEGRDTGFNCIIEVETVQLADLVFDSNSNPIQKAITVMINNSEKGIKLLKSERYSLPGVDPENALAEPAVEEKGKAVKVRYSENNGITKGITETQTKEAARLYQDPDVPTWTRKLDMIKYTFTVNPSREFVKDFSNNKIYDMSVQVRNRFGPSPMSKAAILLGVAKPKPVRPAVKDGLGSSERNNYKQMFAGYGLNGVKSELTVEEPYTLDPWILTPGTNDSYARWNTLTDASKNAYRAQDKYHTSVAVTWSDTDAASVSFDALEVIWGVSVDQNNNPHSVGTKIHESMRHSRKLTLEEANAAAVEGQAATLIDLRCPDSWFVNNARKIFVQVQIKQTSGGFAGFSEEKPQLSNLMVNGAFVVHMPMEPQFTKADNTTGDVSGIHNNTSIVQQDGQVNMMVNFNGYGPPNTTPTTTYKILDLDETHPMPTIHNVTPESNTIEPHPTDRPRAKAYKGTFNVTMSQQLEGLPISETKELEHEDQVIVKHKIEFIDPNQTIKNTVFVDASGVSQVKKLHIEGRVRLQPYSKSICEIEKQSTPVPATQTVASLIKGTITDQTHKAGFRNIISGNCYNVELLPHGMPTTPDSPTPPLAQLSTNENDKTFKFGTIKYEKNTTVKSSVGLRTRVMLDENVDIDTIPYPCDEMNKELSHTKDNKGQYRVKVTTDLDVHIDTTELELQHYNIDASKINNPIALTRTELTGIINWFTHANIKQMKYREEGDVENTKTIITLSGDSGGKMSNINSLKVICFKDQTPGDNDMHDTRMVTLEPNKIGKEEGPMNNWSEGKRLQYDLADPNSKPYEFKVEMNPLDAKLKLRDAQRDADESDMLDKTDVISFLDMTNSDSLMVFFDAVNQPNNIVLPSKIM